MIFLVHFSFFLLIINSKSALACLDGKLFKRLHVFAEFIILYSYNFYPFYNLNFFLHHFTTNQQ